MKNDMLGMVKHKHLIHIFYVGKTRETRKRTITPQKSLNFPGGLLLLCANFLNLLLLCAPFAPKMNHKAIPWCSVAWYHQLFSFSIWPTGFLLIAQEEQYSKVAEDEIVIVTNPTFLKKFSQLTRYNTPKRIQVRLQQWTVTKWLNG